MSHSALAYSSPRIDPRRARVLRRNVRPMRALRPWSEVAVAPVPLQAASGHPSHIKRSQLIVLAVIALSLHASAAWYFSQIAEHRDASPRKSELNIELVRPPKPPKPPKVEPPQPQKPRPQQAQVLPPIQQSEPLPSTVAEATEAPVTVAPIVSEPPPTPASEPVTPPIGRAGYLNNPAPNYPAAAARQGWQGTVLLRVHVLSTGKVETAEVKQSSGRKLLDDEAIRTVKTWIFTPSKRGEIAIDGWAVVPIEFILD